MIKDHFPDYWLHPDVSEYQSVVVACKANIFSLRDPFPFFIEGGGQPDDKVTVFLPNSSEPLPVLKIISTHDFSLKLPKKFTLQPPFNIILKLDIPFRQAVMRAHTCQHLLSALILKIYSLKTLKAVMNDDQGQLVLDEPFPHDSLADISHQMYEFISTHPVPVTSHVLEASSSVDQNGQSIDLSKIRGSIPKNTPFIRVLSIGSDVDLNTCGGTHISSTDQLLGFFITSTKKSEINFICGLKALSFLTNHNQELLNASQTVNQPINKSLSYLSTQFASLSKQQNEANMITIKLLKSYFVSLNQQLNLLDPSRSDRSIVSATIKDIFTWHMLITHDSTVLIAECPIDKKLGAEALKIFSEFEQNYIVLLLAASDTLLISINHPDRSPFTARDVASQFKKIIPNAKGGGNEFFSQLLIKELVDPFSSIEQHIKALFPS